MGDHAAEGERYGEELAGEHRDDAPEAKSQLAEVNTEVTDELESTGTDPEAGQQEKLRMPGYPPKVEVEYTIGDNGFTGFMMGLRCILADHPDHNDIRGRSRHPLLAKPRADEQPARWIHIRLQIVEDEQSKETVFTTLVLRDDNVDVMGFRNNKGDWYELGNRRMLPEEYNSVLLGWGNSYKSILAARNESEVVDRLMRSTNLGKEFAEHAVRVLSRFTHDEVDGIQMTPRLALVGLMFMVSESAKMNPVHDAIARGWDTGTGFTEQLMTDYVWKYIEMSRRLREWKRRNYAGPHPYLELRAIYLVLNGNCKVAYTIRDEVSSFNSFMEDLRVKLAEHPDREDIMDRHRDPDLKCTRNHPMLAKQRADGEQPARWILVELQVEDTKETTLATLVIRDDNMDIMGFMNRNRDWYELGYQRMLPQEYRSKLLGWGNSYKSILGVRNEKEVMDTLMSANLGKTFATLAVRMLSHFDPNVAVDVYNIRLALVGLMFMVSESAKMNLVHDAITRGWVTGKGFTKELMTNYVWKYVEMSRRLRHWKKGDYAQPEPKSELDAIYLVLNEEYIMGDLLSSAYPEVLKVSFPEMFKEMFMVPYTVKVKLMRRGKKAIDGVHGKILAFISDGHRHSVPFRAGSMLFISDGHRHSVDSEGSLVLERSVVVVPSGWVLSIDVDLQIEIPGDSKDKVLKATLIFDKETLSQSQTPKNTGINVEVTITRYMQDLRAQLSGPVEGEMVSWHPTAVYTIGDDAMSFIEFIIALRRILSEHPEREDILDGHRLLNLSFTQQNPLLAKTSEQPGRWLHAKLQAVEQGKMLSTTLVMRDDDMFVHGFFNHNNGVLYRLCDEEANESGMLSGYHHQTEDLKWGISYPSILKVDTKLREDEKIDEILKKLSYERDSSKRKELPDERLLGSDFMMDAVRRLSSSIHPNVEKDGLMRARLALAGLIFMVCESARMNPVLDSFAREWKDGITRLTSSQLMKNYVWKWGDKSTSLREWKEKNYRNEPGRISEALDIYLVRNSRLPCHQQAGGMEPSSSGGDSSVNQPKKDSDPSSRPEDNPPSPSEEGVNPNDPSQHNDEPGKSKGPSQPMEADDAQNGHGRRPRVELLAIAMHRDDLVDGMEIVVFDGKRGQIVYRKDEQGRHHHEDKGQQEDEGQRRQGMVDLNLVLTGPYRGISAEYGCFSIKIDIPRTTSTGTRSGSDKYPPIKWEWDCDDPRHAAQVDTMRPARGIITTWDGHKVGKVTYVVMSDALEAKVQVKLRLKDGHSPGGISGKVTARIDGFKNKHKSILFRCAKGKGQRFSTTTNDNSWVLLELARNVVVVPRGKVLHIVVHLKIEADDGQKVEMKVPLRFDNGICSTQTDDGKEVEVLVTWYPEVGRSSHPPEQEFSTTPAEPSGGALEVQQQQIKTLSEEHLLLVAVDSIRDSVSFTEFITDLRRILAKHADREDILEHPLLARQRAEQPARWVHVELQVVDEINETLSTTLLLRDDNLYVHGFMNQQGGVVCCYELLDSNDGSVGMLPKDYNPKRLNWGVNYRTILSVGRLKQPVVDKLASAKLDKTFMGNAVRVLSRWRQSDEQGSLPGTGSDTNMSPRVALAGLIFIICESARMNSVRDSFADVWSNGKAGFTKELMYEYVWKYPEMSSKLREWKTRNYAEPHCIPELKATYLVLNTWLSADYYPMGYWRRRVELFAMHADLAIAGTTITIFDGKRAQVIYTKGENEEAGQQGIVDLVLTGPYIGISAYGCFAIKIAFPNTPTTGSSSGSDTGLEPIIWEWNCYDPEYTAEVDRPLRRTISSSGPGRNVHIQYAVMSNALEATVEVMLRNQRQILNNKHSPSVVHGNITACIANFGESVLFSRTKRMRELLSSNKDSLRLNLARNVVSVPCGAMLRIEVDLYVETFNHRWVNHVKVTFSFDSGHSCGKLQNVKGDDIMMSVMWYP